MRPQTLLALLTYQPALLLVLSLPAYGQVEGGVIVEEVVPGYAAHAAGLKPGDRVMRWSREPNPPANPRPARGEIHTPFDLAELEIEEAPRGQLTLSGVRGNATTSWIVPQDDWRIRVHPIASASWQDRFRDGLRLVRDKRVREGVAIWRRGTDVSSTGSSWLTAWLLFRSAEAFTESRDWLEADEHYALANQMLKDLQMPAARAEVLRAFRDSLDRRGHAAEQATTRLIEALECEVSRNPSSLAVARTEFLLGRAELRQGRPPKAEARYLQALSLQEQQAPRSGAIADTLTFLADVEMRVKEVGRAAEFIDRALSIREAINPNGIGFARALALTAWLALGRSDLESAAEGFRRALLALDRSAPESREAAFALTGLANTQLRLGEFRGADDAYRRSLELYERVNPDGEAQGSVLYGLGQVALYRHDLDMAENYFQKSLAVLTKSNPDSTELPIALHGLGDVAAERERFGEAERYLRQSLAINESRSPSSERTAWDLRCLALALVGTGSLDEASERARRSLEIRELLVPGSYEVSASLATVARIAMLRGELDTSLRRYQESLAIRSRRAPGSSMEAESLEGMARVQRKRGQLDAAAELFDRAVATLEQQRMKLGGDIEGRSSFGAGYSGCYREYVEVLLELHRPAEAFHALERSRARGLLAMLAERATMFVNETPKELIERQRGNHAAYDKVQADLLRLEPNRDGGEIRRLQGRLRELREEAAQIIARVRQVSPSAASLQYPTPLDLDTARAALDPGTVLLTYSVGENQTTLFVVQANGAPYDALSVFSLPAGRKRLGNLVERLRNAIEISEEGVLGEQAAELYALLVRPAEHLLANAERLVISPDGPLHLLPFAALTRERSQTNGWHYLVEWKPLHVVASATVYAEIKKRRQHQPLPRIGLDPVSKTPSERWIRCRTWSETSLAGGRAGSSLRSSKREPFVWCWTKARRSERLRASWT